MHAYSPDFNPMERVWANFKRLIRSHPDRESNLQLAIDEFIGLLFMC